MARDPMHKSVCDKCYRGTWYENEGQACRMTVGVYCKCCRQRTGDGPCTGKLRLIDRSELVPRFSHYYESGERIRVAFPWGVKTGTIGKTMGWRPSYMLMARADSIGSSDLLDETATIVAVKRNGTYRAAS